MGQSPVTEPAINPVVNKIFSEDYIAAYEHVKSMNIDKTRNYERDIIKGVTKYLVSHPSLPMPSFNFALTNKILQSQEPENNDDTSFLSQIFGVTLNDPNKKQYLESITEKIQKIIETGLSHRLHYVGFSLIALVYILNQDAISKLRRYVRKTIEYSQQDTMLSHLKFALDDLKTKISAIQDILPMNNLTKLSKDEKKELVLSLFFPCEEIYQKITMEGGIYQTFAFYMFEIVVLSFIVELGVFRVAMDEFEINVHDKLKSRCDQYPLIIEKYLKLMADQRPKLKIEKTEKGDALKDTLANEYIYVSDYPYGLLAVFMRSNDNFYDAYKEKFQGNIDFFKKAMSELIENKDDSELLLKTDSSK